LHSFGHWHARLGWLRIDQKGQSLKKKNGGRIPAIALIGFAGLDDKSKAMAAGLSSAYFKTCRLGQSNF